MVDPGQATVIIIDDDDALRTSLQTLLGTADYRCLCYASAEGYLEQTPPPLPSCLLLDLHLPGMSGIELQRQISVQRPRLPVVFLSGDASATEIDQAIVGGALDFLCKPFDADQLMDSTARCLTHSLDFEPCAAIPQPSGSDQT